MKIAYLILCHTDPQHIVRLSKRLATYADVYIHVDVQTDISSFQNPLAAYNNIYFLTNRLHLAWGGYQPIPATIELMRMAFSHCFYERVILLQGADYPIKKDSEIISFFESHRNTEFIRACRLSDSTDSYFKRKQYGYWFYTHRNFITRFYNNMLVQLYNHFPLKLTHGFVEEKSQHFELYWGAAQFSITGSLAQYLIQFYDTHPKFNQYFKHAFPCDEMYFATIVFNSPFAEHTYKGIEAPAKSPEFFSSLHYFEYKNLIRIWTKDDYAFLITLPKDKLFCRKVNTKMSSSLLDLLDISN